LYISILSFVDAGFVVDQNGCATAGRNVSSLDCLGPADEVIGGANPCVEIFAEELVTGGFAGESDDSAGSIGAVAPPVEDVQN
jgi:hypothetical protein